MKRDKLIEIAKKAGLGTEIHLSPRQGGAQEEHIWGGEMQTKIMEKFAELIVKECYDVCKDNLVLLTEHDSDEAFKYNEGVADCAILIKQRFGVH